MYLREMVRENRCRVCAAKESSFVFHVLIGKGPYQSVGKAIVQAFGHNRRFLE
jgi:uncharacterized protein YpbB